MQHINKIIVFKLFIFWFAQSNTPSFSDLIGLPGQEIHNLQLFSLQSNLYYPYLDYPDFFSSPNFVMNIY